MSFMIRCLAIIVVIVMAVLLYAQDTGSTSKKETTAPQDSGGYYYALDPVTGAYRMYQSNSSSLPTLRSDDSQPLSNPNRFGEQWFQICSTTGLSSDGKTLFVQLWFEKEVQPTQFDTKAGAPTLPRKLAIQEVIREVSLEKLKVQFFNADGKVLAREDVGKLLKESKTVVLINGAKPANSMLSVFAKNTVIAVYQPSPMGAY